ncbi:pectate lyase-like adhesive domain-containing protein, partial [Methanobrevibacter thaueri]|uniref:pectate lyase-like adhesive domain-containing protein n=1 Tax=Methanobrevibacter thaueri TaxID=190975 RepID=UPI003869E76A
MKKGILILTLLILALFSVSCIYASDVNDTLAANEDTGVIELSHEIESADDNLGTIEEQKVTQTDNEEKTGATDDGTFEALQSKIGSASSGDTIYLENNYSCEDSWTQTGGIYIYTSNLVIDGQGYTIDAKGKTRIFYVDVDNVTIKNIKFINAKFKGVGGAIYWSYSANGSVSGCSFVNCSAYNGGAIYWSNSANGSVSGCSFVNCSANYGGAIEWSHSDYGSVSGCSFVNCSAEYGGGAIYAGSCDLNADYNWFGNNATNYNDPLPISNSVHCDYRLFLSATANPDTISVSDTSNIIFKLYQYHSGNITEYDNAPFKNIDLTVTATNGNVSKNTTKLGEPITFTPTSIGTGSITATIENIAYTTTLTVTTDGTTFWDLNNAINNNTNDTITLDKNYAFDPVSDSAFTGGIGITRPVTINGNGHTIDAKGKARVFNVPAADVTIANLTIKNANYNGDGGAVYFAQSGRVINCNFTNNKATDTNSWGGAIRFIGSGTVTNCNFADNQAGAYGGAVYFYRNGNVTNCNFTGNTASKSGGAVYFDNTGNVRNCNFTGNNATTGSAIYFYKYYSTHTLTVSDSTFLNNRANAEALDVVKNDDNITITFTGQNNLLNAIYSRNNAEVTFTNVEYWGANGITTVSATMSGSNRATGQNITVKGVVNGKIINKIKGTDENGEIVLDDSGDYWIIVSHKGDSYYTEVAETVFTNMKLYANVTSVTTTNKTVNITAKSNIPQDVVQGKLLFVLPNGTEINATYGTNGTWWAVHKFADYDVYQVNATYQGLDNVTITNATISISKTPTAITVENETLELLVGDSIGTGAALTPADAGELTFTS